MSNDNLNHLAEELSRSLCRTLLRLLAQGQPVSAEVLAETSGRSREDVLSVVHASSNVELDGQGRIVGAGLSLRPTPHRLSVDGRRLVRMSS